MELHTRSEPQLQRASRFLLHLPVTVVCGGVVVGGVTRNISLAGMFIELEDAQPFGSMDHLVGANLMVSLSMPNPTEELVTEAVVRWTSADNGLGVQLLRLSAQDRLFLERLFIIGNRAG
jgi:hypothetical protein